MEMLNADYRTVLTARRLSTVSNARVRFDVFEKLLSKRDMNSLTLIPYFSYFFTDIHRGYKKYSGKWHYMWNFVDAFLERCPTALLLKELRYIDIRDEFDEKMERTKPFPEYVSLLKLAILHNKQKSVIIIVKCWLDLLNRAPVHAYDQIYLSSLALSSDDLVLLSRTNPVEFEQFLVGLNLLKAHPVVYGTQPDGRRTELFYFRSENARVSGLQNVKENAGFWANVTHTVEAERLVERNNEIRRNEAIRLRQKRSEITYPYALFDISTKMFELKITVNKRGTSPSTPPPAPLPPPPSRSVPLISSEPSENAIMFKRESSGLLRRQASKSVILEQPPTFFQLLTEYYISFDKFNFRQFRGISKYYQSTVLFKNPESSHLEDFDCSVYKHRLGVAFFSPLCHCASEQLMNAFVDCANKLQRNELFRSPVVMLALRHAWIDYGRPNHVAMFYRFWWYLIVFMAAVGFWGYAGNILF